jgi:hypothetical protein
MGRRCASHTWRDFTSPGPSPESIHNHEEFGSHAADLVSGLSDCRHPRPECGCQREIVIGSQRDIFRAPHAQFVQRIQHAKRHHAIGDEQRGGPR